MFDGFDPHRILTHNVVLESKEELKNKIIIAANLIHKNTLKSPANRLLIHKDDYDFLALSEYVIPCEFLSDPKDVRFQDKPRDFVGTMLGRYKVFASEEAEKGKIFVYMIYDGFKYEFIKTEGIPVANIVIDNEVSMGTIKDFVIIDLVGE